jgi:TonB family protein
MLGVLRVAWLAWFLAAVSVNVNAPARVPQDGPASASPQSQAPRPGMPTSPSGAMPDEATLKRNMQANPKDPASYIMLAMVYEKTGDVAKAAATFDAALAAVPAQSNLILQAASFYNRQGDIEKSVSTLSQWESLEPQNPFPPYTIATFYWEKAYRDARLSDGEKRTYINLGLHAVDRALAISPDSPEALTYKNLLLRSLALLDREDEEQYKKLIQEADKLRDRAIEIRKARAGVAGQPMSQPVPGGSVGVPGGPPPAPSTTAPDGRMAPVRVGGTIKPPQKLVDARAVMPDAARQARVQGVVIVEMTIGPDGKVADAKILRSIPLLDQAALDAVRQWEFTPTLLNGTPVPVIMTVTVNFTID